MAFQAEQKIKSQILNTLGTDRIFRLLSDSDINVLMKTLGLLRNLLSTKPVCIPITLNGFILVKHVFNGIH